MEHRGLSDPSRGVGLARRRVRVADADAVWFRSVLESYEGLASWHADGSGVFTLTTPVARAPELDALLAELSREAALRILPGDPEEGGMGPPSEP